jgi:hypothetical protein
MLDFPYSRRRKMLAFAPTPTRGLSPSTRGLSPVLSSLPGTLRGPLFE